MNGQALDFFLSMIAGTNKSLENAGTLLKETKRVCRVYPELWFLSIAVMLSDNTKLKRVTPESR